VACSRVNFLPCLSNVCRKISLAEIYVHEILMTLGIKNVRFSGVLQRVLDGS
jgi:hypothetical protein